jgi:hypothetical protein
VSRPFLGILLLITVLCTVGAAPAVAAGSVLDVSPNHLRFGRQAYDTSITKTVTITNTSSESLLVSLEAFVPDDFSPGQLASTCLLSYTTNVLGPGATCTHVIGFSPSRAFQGRQTGELLVRVVDASGTVLESHTVKLSGTGVEP